MPIKWKRNDKEWYVLYLLLKDVRRVDYFARRRSQLMAHTLQGNGTGTGTRTGNGINGFFVMQKCSHWSETETGTGTYCVLLCLSHSLYRSRSRSRAVYMSHYTSGLSGRSCPFTGYSGCLCS